MAIFSKNDNEEQVVATSQSSSETTVIAHGANIKGDFAFECRLHVDGHLEGSFISNNLIVIGKRGYLKGDLKADKLVVNGEFEGSADCNTVEVLSGGKFIGDVISQELTIEAKAKFQGQSKIREEEQTPAIPILEPDED